MTGSWMRRGAVLALAGFAIGAVPTHAGAEQAKRALDVEILSPSLGKVWDAGAVRVRVDAGRAGTAKWNIPAIDAFPFGGSAIVYWDGGPEGFDGTIGSGTSAPPNANVPPMEVDDENEDPHSYPRRDVQARQQKSDFLQVDGFINPCTDDGPCYANGYPGPAAP